MVELTDYLEDLVEQQYTALVDHIIKEAEGFLLVYSITSRSSFANITTYHEHIQRAKAQYTWSPTYPGQPGPHIAKTSLPVPIYLLGNKCDVDSEREVSTHEGEALAKELRCKFMEVSAKNGVNTKEPLYYIVRSLRQYREQDRVASMPREAAVPPAETQVTVKQSWWRKIICKPTNGKLDVR
jgi:GTPase KRas protein